MSELCPETSVTLNDVIPLMNSAAAHLATCTRYFMEAHALDQVTAMFLLHNTLIAALFGELLPENLAKIEQAIVAAKAASLLDDTAAL